MLNTCRLLIGTASLIQIRVGGTFSSAMAEVEDTLAGNEDGELANRDLPVDDDTPFFVWGEVYDMLGLPESAGSVRG